MTKKFASTGVPGQPTGMAEMTPRELLEFALSRYASNLWGEMAGKNAEDFRSLSLSVKDDGSLLAIARRYGGDGTPEVCFGSSDSFVGALLALSKAIGKDAWKADKYALK